MEEVVSCIHCKEEFSDEIKLNLHLIKYMPMVKDPCVVCKNDIPECISRRNHLNSHPSCKICFIHFKSNDFLTLHKITYHSESLPRSLYSRNINQDFICYLCDMSFSDLGLIEIHISCNHFILKNIFSKIFKETCY